LRRGIENAVNRFATEAGLWPPDGGLLVAVSGGPDSSGLLLVMQSLAGRLGLKLTAAYFDHKLRGVRASAAERSAVRALAEHCGVELVMGEGDVAALKSKGKLTLEEAARRARYDFLARVAEERDIATVAVGHTLDDQAETVLMHVIRGAGLTGLGGMHPNSRWPSQGHDDLTLVRPLLGLRRGETEAYCRAAGIRPLEDASNRSRAFLRNRVRRELLPALRRYNPRVEEALARLADAARQNALVLEALAEEAVSDAARPRHAGRPEVLEGRPGKAVLDRQRLRGMPAAVRAHAVRLALLRLIGDLQGFGERHLRAVERAALADASGLRLDLPRGVTASIDRNTLVLRKGAPEQTAPLPRAGVRLQVPGEVRFGELRVAAGAESIQRAVASVMADAGAVGAEVCLRAWRTGDRMQPLGMKGTKKLQDLFVDAHVPKEGRAAVPVFEAEQGIVWVGGLRLAEWARPREGSPTVVLSYGLA